VTTWDEFDKPTPAGDFPPSFKFDMMGASIAGTITEIRTFTATDGRRLPDLWIDTDEGPRSVICGPTDLLTQLLDKRPNVGDRIAIVYASQRKAGQFMQKIFDVSLKRADSSESKTEPAAAAQNATVKPKTAADLL